MKIAYVSLLAADDPHSWSGLNYNIARCLRQQGATLELVGPLHDPGLALLAKVTARIQRAATSKRVPWTRQSWLLRFYGAKVRRLLATRVFDLVFSPGTEPIAYLPAGDSPVVFWTDAPFAAMNGYYAWYQGLSAAAVAAGLACDHRALARSALGIYSSGWAAEAASAAHGAYAGKIAVVPFGANLRSEASFGEIEELATLRLRPPWRFLFVGVDWERKGGDAVLATVNELNRRGFPSELVIVGCEPPRRVQPLPRHVTIEGFIDQRGAAGQARLGELYRSALFLFMPSSAEAYGIVYCEANAHGVPCLATDTGGVPTIIRNGQNGQLFPPGALTNDYVDFIEGATAPAVYRGLARGALEAARTRLNWDVAGRATCALLEDTLRQGHRPQAPAWSNAQP